MIFKKGRKEKTGKLSTRALAALLALVMCGAVLAGCAKTEVPVKTSSNYAKVPLADYSRYTGLGMANETLGVDNVLAAYKGVNLVYYRCGITQTDAPLLIEEDEVLKLDAAAALSMLGKTAEAGYKEIKNGDELEGFKVTVYANKLVVLTLPDNALDTYNDIYTLEQLSLYLSSADPEDVQNAFITLPDLVINGSNAVYYTSPDMDLGLQTNVYYSQIGDTTVTAGPALVAGQGANAQNFTLVRVFNRQQAISAQFLAYPPDVRGGVRVAAGGYADGDSREVLIATASVSGEGTVADTIRIFDQSGIIRAGFKPEGIEAPYVIATGRFVEGSSDEYLAVMSENQSGSGKLQLYALSDFTLRDTLEFTYSGKGSEGGKAALSVKKGSSTDSIIMYFDSAKAAFLCDPVAKTVNPLELELSDKATGVYDSAFDDGFNVTLNDGTFSHIMHFTTASGAGSELNVGWRENRFYSSFAEDNPEGYVDKGTFNHVRTDLAAPILARVKKDNAREILTESKYNTFKYWSINFNSSSSYHASYNMWEPCFTHRWNSMASTIALSGVKDDDGNVLYGSIGRDNLSTNYLELDSAFLIGSYADGILEMSKMRLYPLRAYLRSLAVDFRGEKAEPEKLIAVSPVHEQEINIAGSIGDYNVYMIRGFLEYLLDLYGSIENINKRFGTPFTSEADFDAPRYDPKQDDPSKCRGEWDTYGGSDFFTQWSLYTRYIVNKRIMEAYREALLAGFPPEAINAHQIPEGDAVSGFLGEADTRLSPIEAVTVCGTAYGGTRYGLWYGSNKNFLLQAYNAGHRNITLGEYGSITASHPDALAQLRYMFEHGVRMVHMIIPLSGLDYKYSLSAEQDAIATVQAENKPRTVTTGLTEGMLAYEGNGLKFNIVQMCAPDENGELTVGLLKSIDEAGGWEGTVYLVPFHANVDVVNVAMNGSLASGFTSDKVSGLQCGDHVELTFDVENTGTADSEVTISVYNGDYKLENACVTYKLPAGVLTPCRYVLSNQLTLEDVRIEVTFAQADGAELDLANMYCTAQYENIAHKYFGDNESVSSAGGVFFDVLSR